MKAYVLVFIITLILSNLSQYCYKYKKNKTALLLLIINLFILSIIAGVRSSDVGKDVNNYPRMIYNLSERGYSISRIISTTKIEPLFILIIFCAAKIGDFHFALFCIQVVGIIPIFILAKNNKKNITMIMMIYILTMYVRSFNLIRQYMAIAYVILSINLLENKKIKKAIICLLLSVSIHTSSLIGILLFILYKISKYKDEKKRKEMYLLIFFACLIFTLGIEKIAVLLPKKYQQYFGSKYDYSTFSILSLLKNIVWVVIAAIMMRYSKKKKNQSERYNFYFVISVFNVLFYCMSSIIGTFGRLSLYFVCLFYFGVLPYFNKCFKEKIIANVLIIMILVAFWCHMTLNKNSGDNCYPYKSDVIEILND